RSNLPSAPVAAVNGSERPPPLSWTTAFATGCEVPAAATTPLTDAVPVRGTCCINSAIRSAPTSLIATHHSATVSAKDHISGGIEALELILKLVNFFLHDCSFLVFAK